MTAENEARDFAQRVINDPAYRQSVMDRARAGTLPPEIEELVWHYALEPVRRPSNEQRSGAPRRLFVVKRQTDTAWAGTEARETER